MPASLGLTVLIPAHNAEATIARAVRSALEQTLPPAAVIVIDDASTDATAQAAEQAGARVLPGPGRGAAGARNVGLRAAESDWVGFLDADDWWHEGLIAAAADAVSTCPGAVACFVAAEAIDDDGVVVARHAAPARISLPDLVLGRVVATTSATVVSRAPALRLGGFYEELRRPAGIEDMDLWVRLAAAGPCVGVPHVHATYVVHDGRDAARPTADLADLEADRQQVVDRMEALLARPLPHARAVMEARTARYWLRAARPGRARAAAARSLRSRPTREGVITLALTLAPAGLRTALIAARRRVARG